MLEREALAQLQKGRSLLAFSGGVDSSALFHLLLEHKIPFDIAIVNYQTRPQSDDEVAHARALAKEFDKVCYVLESTLAEQNFEASARQLRYRFFETLILEHGYTNLITAHQLDDRLEWFLMQFSKGAGLHELMGPRSIEQRNGYRLIRPLLQTTRADIKRYLNDHALTYFEDESNRDEKYKRNFFRHNVAAPLLERYSAGIKKSFVYLGEDRNELTGEAAVPKQINALHYFPMPVSRRSAVVTIDRILKEEGFLMRRGDKEALKVGEEQVVGRKFAVVFHADYCFIAPYVTDDMPKSFKEQCRKLMIPRIIRPYLFNDPQAFETVVTLLTD